MCDVQKELLTYSKIPLKLHLILIFSEFLEKSLITVFAKNFDNMMFENVWNIRELQMYIIYYNNKNVIKRNL